MLVAFFARVVAPQLFPSDYRALIWIAAAGWSGCFTIIAVRLAPLVLQPRVDGKEH
jgi:uncharacterized protein involved in response to NO